MEELEAGIKSSRYFSGILKCRGTKDSGYVNGGSQLDKDILIVGPENVNRAGMSFMHLYACPCIFHLIPVLLLTTKTAFLCLVHGDLVVVELLSENNWTTAPNTIAYGGGSAEDGNITFHVTRTQASSDLHPC